MEIVLKKYLWTWQQQPKLPGLMTPYELQLTHQKLLAASGRFGPDEGAPSTAEVRFMARVESLVEREYLESSSPGVFNYLP